MGTLAQSMALMLEEFYKTLTAVGVSALTGDGIDDFFVAVDKAAAEYESTYAVEMREKRRKRDEARAAKQASDVEAYAADRAAEAGQGDGSHRTPGAPGAPGGQGGIEAAGATVVLGGTTAAEAEAARRLPHEGSAEEAEYEHAGFTAADEAYNRDLAHEDQQEFASLQRFLQAEREKRAEREPTTDQ